MVLLKSVIVDDDTDDLEFFQAACDEICANVNLQTFSSCEDLFKFLDQKDFVPDVMFVDINMPVMNGFECLQNIRERWSQNERCVIMYSTSDNPQDIKKCFDLGANGFLQKPYSFPKLKAVLQKIFDTDWSDPCENLSEIDFVLTPKDSDY